MRWSYGFCSSAVLPLCCCNPFLEIVQHKKGCPSIVLSSSSSVCNLELKVCCAALYAHARKHTLTNDVLPHGAKVVAWLLGSCVHWTSSPMAAILSSSLSDLSYDSVAVFLVVIDKRRCCARTSATISIGSLFFRMSCERC